MEPSNLPQARAWAAEMGGFDLRNFLLTQVSVAEAFSVAELLAPRFVEYRDCVFLNFAFDPDGIDIWMNKLNGDQKSVEEVVNHIHLWDFFSPGPDLENEALIELAHKMAELWKISASAQFPDRGFFSASNDGTDDYGPSLVIYTLCKAVPTNTGVTNTC